jgi:hypothetical protein
MESDRAPRSGRAAISLPEESGLVSAGLLRDPETVRLDGLADSADVMAAESATALHGKERFFESTLASREKR